MELGSPVAGAIAGGLAGTGLGPAGTAGGAALGYAGGKELSDLGKHYLFGEELPPNTPKDQAIRVASNLAEAGTMEMAGPLLAKAAPVVAKGAGAIGRRLIELGEAGRVGKLDMSEPARLARAKEMGFDTGKTWYHGTSGNIKEFDPGLLGGKTTGPTKELGFHFSSSPDVAADYANISDTKSLASSRIKANDILDKAMAAPKGSELRESLLGDLKKQNLKTAKLESAQSKKVFGENGNIIPAHLKMKNPAIIDIGGGQLDDLAAAKARAAKAAGHDGVIFKNAHDSLWRDSGPNAPKSDVAIAFEPNQIRSVNAKFDPAKKKSGNILAGIAAAISLTKSKDEK